MPAVPFKVKAVYEYNSAEPDDLTFPNGQIITVTDDADEDWYTGEYTSASGEKVEGIFPRNFVEKYEPAIPSRPARAPTRAPVAEPEPEQPKAQEPVSHEEPADVAAEPEPEPEIPKAAPQPAATIEEPPPPKAAEPPPQRAAEPKPPIAKSGPPPVAEKPSSSSFKDRIAAFNKPAAAPVAPFKPGGTGSSGFIKKPFVAPPPSKNAYVPPPREPPPQKVYHREEEHADELPSAERDVAPPPQRTEETVDEDQPKPTSLKDRIALLQKQQMEQAQRQADAVQKKEKPKKPPKKRSDPVEEADMLPAEPGLERLDTNETVGKTSSEFPREPGSGRPSMQRQESAQSGQTPIQPPRELVSDTNDADDSGAADTEDAQETSTEEERPRPKGATVGAPTEVKKPVAEQKDDEDEEEEEEDTEEDEDPEIKRKRELRERMAKMSGGMGMMGMFGPPGGAAPAPRKSRPSQEHSRETEQHVQEEAARAPPVPIMALPGMSNQLPKRQSEPEDESDEDIDTAQPTPQEPPKHVDRDDDYVSQPPPPPRRSDTMRSSASLDRPPPPPPPQREDTGLRSPQETRAVPPPPPTSGKLSIPC